MPKCGSQIILCEVPIRYDTYSGCSHGCKYCFAYRKGNIEKIGIGESYNELKKFIEGDRTGGDVNWCDWQIPIHWGGMSDPFQPLEREKGLSLKVLKLFRETQYPFIVSTKNKLIAEGEYFDEITKCNCVVQFSAISPKYDKIETGASLSSPQNVIVSCVANYLKIPCICLYGGAKESSLQMPMPMLCKKYGAEIIVAKSGRHNVIYSMASELSQERGYQIIEYGMNAQDNIEAFYEANANQVQNIPDELDNLVVTCGSGITSTGIIYGLTKYRKKVKNLILVGTAPNREKKIQERLSLLGHPPAVFQYVDLFSQKGFSYDKREHSIIRMKDYSLELHPNYEAKVNNWIVNHIDPGKEKTLLWVVGVEPKR